jgi:hypothetical protein
LQYYELSKHHHHEGNEGSISQMLFGDKQLNSGDANDDPAERDPSAHIERAVPMLVKVAHLHCI